MIIIKRFENKNILVVDTASLKTSLWIKNLWYFATEVWLPWTATNWDYAIVWSTDTVWVWDWDTNAWKNTNTASTWDMMKSVYDTDNDWKVDAAETADSVEWSWVQNKPTAFNPISHSHDDRYYTDVAMDILLAWKQDNIWFTPENISNKKTTMTGNASSNTFYLTAKAVYDWVTWLLSWKQDTLVSWVNLKTINWVTLLWSDNIVIAWVALPAYTVTGHTTDRAINVANTTLNEVANVLATHILDTQNWLVWPKWNTNLIIWTTEPVVTEPTLWINTTGGNITLNLVTP